MQVLVRDNNVDQALRVLKKKLQREGVFREMKARRAYEKPSEKRAREKGEAVRRARKLARKKACCRRRARPRGRRAAPLPPPLRAPAAPPARRRPPEAVSGRAPLARFSRMQSHRPD
jgi:small subunit ribosomal protein S21